MSGTGTWHARLCAPGRGNTRLRQSVQSERQHSRQATHAADLVMLCCAWRAQGGVPLASGCALTCLAPAPAHADPISNAVGRGLSQTELCAQQVSTSVLMPRLTSSDHLQSWACLHNVLHHMLVASRACAQLFQQWRVIRLHSLNARRPAFLCTEGRLLQLYH